MKTLRLAALVLAGLFLLSSQAYASAFQLWEQNGAGVGDVHAGGAAEAADASTGFYNPAGLVRITNQQVVAGSTIISTNILFKGRVSDNLGDTASGSAQAGVLKPVPFFHYAAPLTDKAVLGFGVTAPFGLATRYASNSIAADSATKTEMRTINIGPSLGYSLNPKWSVGVGFDIQYLKATFNNAISENPTNPDKNEGDDWGYGWNAGILYQLSHDTRFGLSFRSSVYHKLRGDSTFVDVDDNNTKYSRNDLTARVRLPSTTRLSGYHEFNKEWTMLGTVSYTRWDSINAFVLVNTADPASTPTGGPLTVRIPANYRNTWNFALGTHYSPSENWTFKAGVGYDETPVRNSKRDLRLPDNNHVSGSLGVHNQLTKTLGVDLGWTHIFMRRAKVNTTQSLGILRESIQGSAYGSADVVGLQLTWDIM